MFHFFLNNHKRKPTTCIGNRDLARTHLACLLDRQFPENLVFEKANFSIKKFNFGFLGVIIKYFLNKPSSRTLLKCKIPFLVQYFVHTTQSINIRKYNSRLVPSYLQGEKYACNKVHLIRRHQSQLKKIKELKRQGHLDLVSIALDDL